MTGEGSRAAWWLRTIAGLALCAGCGADAREESTSEASSHLSDPSASAPVRALLGVFEWSDAQTGAIDANSWFHTVYSGHAAVQANDVLRIHGQVSVTNDSSAEIGVAIRTLVNGVVIGSSSSENVQPCCGTHHLPLWTDAVSFAGATGDAFVEVQVKAERWDANPSLKVDAGFNDSGGGSYGHLLVEQYRSYDSVERAADASGYLLSDVAGSSTPLASTFGYPTAYVDAPAYRVSLPVRPGDVVRLLGQATGGWTARGLDMQGQAILANGAVVSPWAAENFPWEVQTTPIFSQAVDRPSTEGTSTYEISLHSALGYGGDLLSSGGHLVAMRFVPASSSTGYGLADAFDVPSSVATSVLANAGPQTIKASSFSADPGDIVRATGSIELAYPSGWDSGISCLSQILLVDGQGQPVAQSEPTQEYIPASLQVLPLRTELVTTLSGGGSYSVAVTGQCFREGGSPTLPLGESSLIVDRYSAVHRPPN